MSSPGSRPVFLTTGSQRLPVLLLILTLGVLGCTSLARQIEPPAVELVGLQVMGAELNRQTFRVSLDVSNPNPVPVPVEALDYRVDVGGGRLAAGRTEETFTLPANGTERIRVELSTDLIGTLGRISALLKGPASTVDYQITGTLTIPLLDPIPFSNSGEVALAMP